MNKQDWSYVGFWPRFLAFLIDSTIASLLIAPFASSTTNLDIAKLSDPGQSQDYLQSILVDLGLESLLMGILFILFWIRFAATPGKLLFKSYIVNASDQKPATKTQLVLRYFGYFISLLPLGLGFIWIGIDKRKQGWHDQIAGTIVINKKPVSEE